MGRGQIRASGGRICGALDMRTNTEERWRDNEKNEVMPGSGVGVSGGGARPQGAHVDDRVGVAGTPEDGGGSAAGVPEDMEVSMWARVRRRRSSRPNLTSVVVGGGAPAKGQWRWLARCKQRR
jgi:hypothetical protein